MKSDSLENIIDKITRDIPLSPEEKEILHVAMKDQSFEKELQMRQNIAQSFQLFGREKLKSKLQEIEEKRRKSKRNKLWIIIILVLILLSALLYKIINTGSDLTVPAQLYAENFIPYPNVIDPISKGAQEIESGYVLYELKKYDEAFQVLSRENNTQSLFYQAMILNIQQLHQEAILKYQQIINSDTSNYKERAQWYLALSFLAIDDTENSINIINEILGSPDHFYYEKANELLKKIKIN